MRKTTVALMAAVLMAAVTLTSVFADGPSPSQKTRVRPAEFNVLLEVSGITPDQKTIIGGFKFVSGMDSGANIVLKRGYTSTDDLWLWWKKVEEGEIDKKSGSIIILDQDLETEVARYDFYEGWPCKWHVPEIDSDQSGMAIEKVEIAVEKIERVMN